VLEKKPGNIQRFSGFDTFLPINLYGRDTKSRDIDWDNREPIVVPRELGERFADFLRGVRTSLGSTHEKRVDSLAVDSRIIIENPGLGGSPGEIEIDLGVCRVQRSATIWSEREIVLDLPNFAGFERFRCPVRVRGYNKKDWVNVGSVATIVGANRKLDTRLVPALQHLT
jgi:hypothetical protein